VPRPVDGVATGHVTGADHGVGAGVQQAQQLGQDGRVVGEVDVHRHDDLVALVEGVGEAGPVRAAEALLAGAPQELDLPQVGGDLLDGVPGPVGTVVVDDEDIGGRRTGPNGRQQRPDVLPLVVGRDHDDRARHHGRRA